MTTTGLMGRDQIAEWILRRLGAPVLVIELPCETLSMCIEDAIRWFVSKKGTYSSYTVDVASAQTEIALPANVEVVTDVATSLQDILISPMDQAFGIRGIAFPGYWHGTGVVGGLGSLATNYALSDFYSRMQYYDMGKRVFSGDFDWRQQGRTLYVSPVAASAQKLIIFYKSNEVNLEQLPDRDHDLVKRFALMRAKEVLGRIRSKYPGGFPGAQSTVELDGSVLLEEAKEEEEKLQEEIGESGYPMGFAMM